jgi:hypothetical protein
LDIAGVAGLGQLPALAGGLAGHIRIAVNGLWPIELGLVRFASQSALASPSSNSADFDLWSGSAAACPWDASLHALSLCGGAEVARLHVEPHFAVRNRARTDVIASVFASLALRIELVGRLHLRSAVVLGAPLPARSYSYEQGSIGHQLRLLSMWPVNARLELGLGLRL